jgi:lactate permease
MQTWTQIYNPFHNLFLSTIFAALPLLLLGLLLGIKKMASHKAVTISWLISAIVAVVGFTMPIKLVSLSSLLGFLNGIMIMYIIFSAILFYNVLVETKQFEIIKNSLASLSNDRRIQAILIAFAFGTLLEAIAGGGTPVAITASILVGMGFDSFYAARLCLLTNTAPVVFGAVGIAVIMLSTVTGLPLNELSAMAGRQTPILSFIVPIMLVWLMSGWKGVKQVWPAALSIGLVFALVQSLVANLMGPMLADVLGAIITILYTIVLLKVWKPRTEWHFPNEEVAATAEIMQAKASTPTYSFKQLAMAWYPFIILVVIVGAWGNPIVLKILNQFTITYPIPGLNNVILRIPPIVGKPSPYAAAFAFNWLSSPGTAVLITTLLSVIFLPKGLSVVTHQVGRTFNQLRYAIITGVVVLGLAWVMNYSGMTSTLAIALSMTGVFFTFFSPFLGWLGVFLTGSDTSSNALFGNLQVVTAHQIGISEVLAAASNSTGGSMGKMISPISLAVATSATGMIGREGELFRAVFKYSVILTAIIGIVATLQAYVFPWMIP